jgi:hypothetical protein
MLIRLTYASRARQPFGPADLRDILRSSQQNNARMGISGALLLCNGIFLQCLEGDQPAVNALYHRILLDSRHSEPAILSFEEIDQRLYGEWAMGYLPSTEATQRLCLRFSPTADFNPYRMRPSGLRGLFAELLAQARMLSD